MAFADPQSVTIGAATSSLPRTGQGIDNGIFTSGDNLITMSVRHAYNVGKEKRTRRSIQLRRSFTASDPSTPSNNIVLSDNVTLVYDGPVQGITAAQAKEMVIALTTLLTAASAVATDKFVGGQS